MLKPRRHTNWLMISSRYYEQVREQKPEILYLYAPGWGATGPDASRQSFAPMLSGYVGVGFEVAGQHNPPLFPIGNEDSGNGLLGALAMLMALFHREKSGVGQLVLNPQLNAAMAHMAHVVRRDDGEVMGANRLDPLQRGVGACARSHLRLSRPSARRDNGPDRSQSHLNPRPPAPEAAVGDPRKKQRPPASGAGGR